MIKKDTIVLYPALGNGHFMSMVELGKLILTHHPSFSITILILTPPNTTNNTPISQYISSLSTTFPSFTFLHIPPINLPTTFPPHLLSLELSNKSNHHVHNLLQTVAKISNIKTVVLDFLTYSASQVTKTLQIPTYFYYTSGASILSVFIHLPAVHKSATKPIKDLHMPLNIPGLLSSITTDDYPDDAKDQTSPYYRVLLDSANTVRDSFGVIVNTFDALEGSVVKALSEGLCVPDGPNPPVFCVGPVISGFYGGDDNGCLSWLDSQPSRSVVLLSFGSLGTFSKTQLKEIAIGLEKSEQRFLWVVRWKNESDERVDSEEQSLDELLPERFLERNKENGLVVKNWAPQAAILSHDSVSGFVTHCGWNSVLEAICEGVPMVAWPLYAEQRMNKVLMVNEMKIALGLNELKDGFVSATELGDRVKELMDSAKGKEIRQRIFKMNISAKEAREDGGTSLMALDRVAAANTAHDSRWTRLLLSLLARPMEILTSAPAHVPVTSAPVN